MGKYFGTSGIREVFNEKLTPELALKVGKALGTYLGGGKVVIGKDTRTSGDVIKSAVISGLLSTGVDVIDIGLAPTPLTGFAIKLYGADAGVTITASHNPPEYNGIKVWQANGMAYTSEMERELESIMDSGNFKKAPWNEIGTLRRADPSEEYINAALKFVKLENSYTVVLDSGNGAGSVVSPYLQRELGNRVISLNSHPSGFFVRELEPNAKSLSALAKTVRVMKADVGIAHDGDADRIGVVDDQGNFVEYEVMLSLIAGYMLRKFGKGKIVTTVDAGFALDDYLRPLGGEVIRTRVGDVAVADELAKHGGVFGGEPSGTWIIPQWNLTPDGIFAGALVLEMIDRLGPISELAKEVPRYVTLRAKIPCPNEKKAKAMEIIAREALKTFDYEGLIDIDGIRIENGDWWILFRPSGTEPIMRITLEAHEEEKAKELMGKAERLVKKAISEA
ncbi:phosphohexomutase [Thermococcus kodakarensis KOD1]|uniref:Probable phosphoglucosamine mutase n=1 Tax=Thermococcus kodakarensis (strain ATCC BAA-918 / JCM 12380 / KOD1) TaxID=69014 RepID=GLMM_THEKO|nr:phosphoglucosamine mutase [Thermococcus kodakarensis]Q68BJ7.1 RecName: Full=Probable phosphoglucosamine mutase [Thermococcus kodakarensis KOD1]WCN28025.1 phosphoglucosamine mutase [Thermococcus kodakarensis]WCN30322.1 phosphoglucosamine mutase [Thermococcus kodakarensis]BAD42439.1 phosphosugar mutase [Thermococcus kodakarensis KOD1]BAD86374.1 phosphohexomutase [Thermococcus kodakarensis KOD1]